MKRTLLSLAVVATALAVVSPSAYADHSWGGYHWKRTIDAPLTMNVVSSVTSQWTPSVSTAIADWNVSTVLDLTLVLGNTSSTSRKKCSVSAGQMRVCNAAYGRNGWLGIAEIWLSGGHIAQARTKLNDSYFSLASYNTPAWRALVACQEIGHDFGLDHQDEAMDNTPLGSCMDYSRDPTPNQHPNAHDYDQLVSIYSHLDGSSSGSSTASALQGRHDHHGGDGDVKVTRDGRYTKVTFITYAA
jgi:predicted Zn-dependent protease